MPSQCAFSFYYSAKLHIKVYVICIIAAGIPVDVGSFGHGLAPDSETVNGAGIGKFLLLAVLVWAFFFLVIIDCGALNCDNRST